VPAIALKAFQLHNFLPSPYLRRTKLQPSAVGTGESTVAQSCDGRRFWHGRRSGHGRRSAGFSVLASRAALAAALTALAGCGLENGPGSLFVDPGHYSVYHCNDLATQMKTLGAKEQELRGLMEKANEGGGGAVIGSLAYRTDYESVLTQERLIQREAAEKKCAIVPSYQSDQTIR